MGLIANCRLAVEDIAAVPPNPGFARDILPIYQDHCLLCHSQPSNHGAPTYFRLDQYDDTQQDGAVVLGAATMAGTAQGRTQANTMPPAAAWGDGLGPNAKAALTRWSQDLRR